MRLKATGRGRRYSPVRAVLEHVQSVVYAGGWPGRVRSLFPTRVREVRHALDVGRAAVGRTPLRLAFASDLHIGPVTSPRLLDEAFAALARFAPDVLLLGGDYVGLELTRAKAERITELVASVPAAVKLGVLGNHDLWTDHDAIARALEAGGVRVLINQSVTLPLPHDDVAVVGLDDPWSGAPDADAAFEGVTAPVRVVVTHAPEGQPLVSGRGAALVLCGHTHGGQIALPGRPVLVFGPHGRRYPCGFYDVDGQKLYVSRGLGVTDVPLRTFAPPDVALFTLR